MCWRRLVQYLLVCARLGQEGEQIHRYSHTHMHTNNTKKRDNRKVLKLANIVVSWRQIYRNQHFSHNHTLACLQETRRLSETPEMVRALPTNKQPCHSSLLSSLSLKQTQPSPSFSSPYFVCKTNYHCHVLEFRFLGCFYFNGFNLLVIIKTYILLMLLNFLCHLEYVSTLATVQCSVNIVHPSTPLVNAAEAMQQAGSDHLSHCDKNMGTLLIYLKTV